MVAQRTREYELIVILSPEATQDEVDSVIERIAGQVASRGGEVIERNNWGIRRFAYPIRKFLEGYYGMLRFNLDSSMVKDLEHTLQASEDILRFLVTKPDA